MAKDEKEPIIVETNAEQEIIVGNQKVYTVKVDHKKKFKVVEKYSKKVLKSNWIFIATEYLDTVKEIGNSKQIFDKWGQPSNGGKKSLTKFGIGKQYEANVEKITVHASNEDFVNGTIYYYESFTKEPNLNSGFYIATVFEPMLFSAYFANYKDEFKYPNEENKSNIHTYKSTIRLFISTHLLPDYTVTHHNFALFEVDIHDTDGNKVTDEPLRYFQKTHQGKFSINTLTELVIEIDPKWREASNHEATKNKPKTFYAKVKTTIYSNKDANPSGDAIKNIDSRKILSDTSGGENTYFARRDKFAGVAPNLEQVAIKVNKEDLVKGWFGEIIKDPTKKKASEYTKKELKVYNTLDGMVLTNQKVSFDVRYDLMDVILDKYEAKKNNMMVVVGDVKYNQKGIEPCKFSSLEVKIKDKKPIEIFNEDKKVSKKILDRTHIPIGIIAGDTPETKQMVTITAKGLATEFYNSKNVTCLGITKKISIEKGAVKVIGVEHKKKKEKEFKHLDIQHVFNMKRAFILFPDRNNNSKAAIANTTGNQFMDIARQQLKEPKYGADSISLELGYIYNKNYDTRAEKWLGDKAGNFTNNLLNKTWFARYLFIWDNQIQSYFVPVTTCRYSNQMVKIDVFPDIEWFVNVKFNTETPVYIKKNGDYHKRENYHIAEKTIKQDKTYQIQRKAMGGVATYMPEINFGYILNGTKMDISISNEHPIFKTVNFALKAYEMLNKLLMSDLSKEKLPLAKASKMGKRAMRSLPIRIEVKRPAFSIGVLAKYVYANNNRDIGWYIKGAFKAEPLLAAEGRLDLLFFAKFIPVAGQAIAAIDSLLTGIELLSFGAVNIDYHIDLVVGAATNIDIKPTAYHSIDGWEGPGISFEQTFEIGLDAGGSIAYDFGKVEGKGTIHADAMAKITITAAYNDKTKSCPAQFIFEGLTALVYIRFEVKKSKGEKNKDTPDKKPERVPILGRVVSPTFELFKTT